MKKLALIATGILFSVATFAQTVPATAKSADVKSQMKTLREDVRAYDKQKAVTKNDVAKGDLAAAKVDLAKTKIEKQEVVADVKVLKTEGVAHPGVTATKEIKKADVKAIKTDVAEIKTDKAAAKADVKSGDVAAAKAERGDIKTDRIELRKDIRAARRDGVKHIDHRVK